MVFQEVFAPYRELWAGASTTVLPEARPPGPELQQGLEHLHLRPEDQEAHQQRPDDGAVVHARPAGHAGAEQELLGRQDRARCPKVVFVPTRDTNSELNAFRSGDVDMIYPQNQIGLRKKIESVDGAKYTTTLGPQWEHFDMLSTVPGLDDLQVRKAIATAMPRQQIVDRVVKDANDNADGAQQHAVHGEPARSTCRTGTSTRRRVTSTPPTRSSTPPVGRPAPTACARRAT